jgi:hypothetical protein
VKNQWDKHLNKCRGGNTQSEHPLTGTRRDASALTTSSRAVS